MIMTLGRVLINAGFGRMSALGANRTRRDGGNDVNDPQRSSGRIRISKDYGASRGHSGFAPENLTTLPHLSISSATSFPKSAGAPGMTVPPSSARRALTAASAKPAFISVLSLSIMWLGVFLGAAMPYHALAS